MFKVLETVSEFTGGTLSEFAGTSEFDFRTCVATEVLVFLVEGAASDFVALFGFGVDGLGCLVAVGETEGCGWC